MFYYANYLLFLLSIVTLSSCSNNNNNTLAIPSDQVNTTTTPTTTPKSPTTVDSNSNVTEVTTTNVLVTQEMNVNLTTKDNGTVSHVEVTAVEQQPGGGVVSYFKTLFKSKPGIGENCTLQEDCEVRESYCSEGLCQCQEGYVTAIDKRHCLKTAKALGDECIQDAQCFAGLNLTEGDALCVSFRCICGTGTIYRNGSCLRSIYLGDNCQSDNDCLTVDSHCLQGVCACPVDMIPGVDNKRCLPTLKTLDGSNCTEDAQCQQFMGEQALCVSEQKCKCKPRNHFNTTMCVPDLKLGEECKQTSDCQTSQEFETKDRRDCINGKCACVNGFTEVSGEDVCINSANSMLAAHHLIYTLLAVFTICYVIL